MTKGQIRLIGLFVGIISIEFIIAGLFFTVDGVPEIARTISLIVGVALLLTWLILMRVVGEENS